METPRRSKMSEVTVNELRIVLDLIDPNPYQPRENEDVEHVEKIAASIEQDGLMQSPVGRLVVNGSAAPEELYDYSDFSSILDEYPEARVQLAFGHTRLAAFKLLDGQKKHGFSLLPVKLRPMTDEEMFRQGIGENLARKDLTAIEEARAMAVYRDRFNKTSDEIGALFNGLSGSAVRNKLRLLDLPIDVQNRATDLSEAVMRDLLYLFNLPEELRTRAEGEWDKAIKPSEIVRDALAGALSDSIRERINSLVTSWRWSKSLSESPWKWDRDFEGIEGVIGPCKTCPHRVTREKTSYCVIHTGCYERKGEQIRREYLEEASKVVGIPVIEDMSLSDHYVSQFGYGDDGKKIFDTAMGARCENLRIMYHRAYSGYAGSLKGQGFPDATIVCKKRNGSCTCGQAIKAGIELTRPGAVESERDGSDDATQEAQPLTANDLKDIAREARAQKRRNIEMVKAIMGQSAVKFRQGLIDQNPGIWRLLLHKISWNASDALEKNGGDVIMRVAEYLVDSIYNTAYGDPTPQKAVERFNTEFKKAGLSELPMSYDDPEPEQPAGKSLMEVFSSEEVDNVV